MKNPLYCMNSLKSFIFLTWYPHFYLVLLWYWYCCLLKIWTIPIQYWLLVLYFNTIQAVLFICARNLCHYAVRRTRRSRDLQRAKKLLEASLTGEMQLLAEMKKVGYFLPEMFLVVQLWLESQERTYFPAGNFGITQFPAGNSRKSLFLILSSL